MLVAVYQVGGGEDEDLAHHVGLLLIAVTRGRVRLWGALLSAGALAWIAVYLFVVVPALRPAALVQNDPHPDIGVFIYCGRTWSVVAGCLLQHPANTVHQLLRPAGGDAPRRPPPPPATPPNRPHRISC